MQSIFFSKEFPLTLKNRHKRLDVSHSMEESRKQQLVPCSREILGLDLAAVPHSMAVIMNQRSMPSGLPLSCDRAVMYKHFVQAAVTVISRNNRANIKTHSADLLKLIGAQRIASITTAFEPIQKYNPKKFEREFAFRVWLQNANGLTSRVLLLSIDKANTHRMIQSFQSVFGNVDVFIIPDSVITHSDEHPLVFSENTARDAGMLSRHSMLSIAHYLDHGQLLNLSQLRKIGWQNREPSIRRFSSDPYQKFLDDYSFYERESPNGVLMQGTLSSNPYVLHLTEYKQAIIASETLKVSRAGCMGNMIYTAVLVGAERNILGGHSIGLYKRKYGLKDINKDAFILFQAENSRNGITNWIEKLGRGRIFLEARNKMMSSPPLRNQDFFKNPPHWKTLNTLSNDAILNYAKIHKLLLFLNINRAAIIETNKRTKLFDMATEIMTKIYKGSNGIFDSFLNNIFFEIIKDYILLFQNDEDSINFCTLKSFNMDNQYSIFFELFPQLRVEWKTGCFPIDIDRVISTLSNRGIIKDEPDLIIFRNFFMDRLFYYINLGCLEGEKDLPYPEQINSFNDLANWLPNLAGIIFNDLIKNKHSKTPFFEEYNARLRECYDASYDNRNIELAIKCGMSGTEEVGVRGCVSVRFFDFDFVKNEHGFYNVNPTTELPVTIKGISENNGFTTRFNGNGL